jgi:excisionase family DNA binding protein
MALSGYLKLSEVCEKLGVSKQTLQRLNDKKKLPMYKFGGRLYLIEAEVEQVLQKGCQGCK